MSDKILLNYLKQTEYALTANNVIGCTTNQTIRTLDTIAGDTAYIRKFGTDYLITQVTDIEDPVDANMTFTVKAFDGTTLGSRTGGGAFSAGSTVTAQGCYLEISASGGNVTVLTTILIDTDVDAGGLDFACAGETVSDGDTLTLYLSDTGSTYYDLNYIYGGSRHTPALNNTRKPYFTIGAGIAALAASNDGVTILDSAVYTEELTISDSYIIQAALGQTPTLFGCIGTNPYNVPSQVHNNTTCVYFNENGDDTLGDGTYQKPYRTASGAITNRGSLHCVYGGIDCPAYLEGAGYYDALTLSAGFKLECDHFYSFIQFNKITIGYSNNTIQNIKFFSPTEGTPVLEIGRAAAAAGTNGVNCYHLDFNSDAVYLGNGIELKNYSEGTINIKWCYFYKKTECIVMEYGDIQGTFDLNIEKNYIYNDDSTKACKFVQLYDDATTGNEDWTIKNNIIYSLGALTGIDILDDTGATKTILIEYNTMYGNDAATSYGIINSDAVTITITCQYNIFSYLTYPINVGAGASLTTNYCCFYSYTSIKTGAGTHTNNNGITSDPKFIDVDSGYIGIKPDGSCYKANGSENNVGAEFGMMLISSSDVTINGLFFDGYTTFLEGIYKTGSTDYTGLEIKWCTFKRIYGYGIDDYSGTATTSNIIDNQYNDCAIGVLLSGGSDTLKQSIFYNNLYGAYLNVAVTCEYHTFYNNLYGIYIVVAGVIAKNNIFNSNIIYNIYSDFSIIMTYSCYDGYFTNSVTITSSTNINNAPLFIDASGDPTDFNLKSIAGGYTINSPCIGISDDSKDIGAYDVTRTLVNEYWKKFRLLYNPYNLNILLNGKGNRVFTDGEGNRTQFSKSHRRSFPMIWNRNSATDIYKGQGIQRKTLEYISTLYPTNENGLSRVDGIVRIHLFPDDYIDTGIGGIVDATTKTIITGKSWIYNEHKGYHVGIKFQTGSGTGSINSTTKKLIVSPSPAWTNDEWIGYYFFYNDLYYYITDNDADELTLSDPDNTLSTVSNINWNIEKYFKINSNTSSVLNIDDDDSELVSGTYKWYINFIECVVAIQSFDYNQRIWAWDKEHAKSGYRITFEEYG